MWFDTLQTAFPGLFVLSVLGLNSGVCLQAAVGLALFIFMGFVSFNTDSICTDLFPCTGKSLGFASSSPAARLHWAREGTLGTQKNPPKLKLTYVCPTKEMSSETPALPQNPSMPQPLRASRHGVPLTSAGTGWTSHCQRLVRRRNRKKEKTRLKRSGPFNICITGLWSSFSPPQSLFCVPTPPYYVFSLCFIKHAHQ